MSGLNENHERRILASLQYADRLLDESVALLSPSTHSPFAKYERDLSPAESHWIESYASRIRDQMFQLLQRFDIQPPQSKILASWSIQTNLQALDIALEDLFPEQMRGYGEMDPETARALTWTLREVKRLVSQLTAFLKRAHGEYGQRLADLDIGSTPKERLARLVEIIHRHRLVEFIPALESIIRKVEAPRLELAVFGRVRGEVTPEREPDRSSTTLP